MERVGQDKVYLSYSEYKGQYLAWSVLGYYHDTLTDWQAGVWQHILLQRPRVER